MRRDYSRGDGWGDDTHTEQMLAESGRRTLTLSEARRNAVLQVLLAEAARLKELSLRAARKPAGWLYAFISNHPVFVRGVSALAGMFFLVGLYALVGGSKSSAGAMLSGPASISERRQGPFGLAWHIALPTDSLTNHELHRGDTVVAFGPVTITYADGSMVVADAGTKFSLLPNEEGISINDGEVASVITKGPHASTGQTKFRVETVAGVVQVKGTEFRVRVEPGIGVTAFTDEGHVVVSHAKGNADVLTGEQIRLLFADQTVLPVVELQVPRMNFETRAKGRVISNKTHIPFETRLHPGATLIVFDALTGQEISSYVADENGVVRGVLPAITDKATIQFRQEAVDGRIGATSERVDVVVDRTPPVLAITRVTSDRTSARISGRTELNAEVRVDGKAVALDVDGAFFADIDLTGSQSEVTITVTDVAGNTTTLVQALK
jgi:hypothetical protein